MDVQAVASPLSTLHSRRLNIMFSTYTFTILLLCVFSVCFSNDSDNDNDNDEWIHTDNKFGARLVTKFFSLSYFAVVCCLLSALRSLQPAGQHQFYPLHTQQTTTSESFCRQQQDSGNFIVTLR